VAAPERLGPAPSGRRESAADRPASAVRESLVLSLNAMVCATVAVIGCSATVSFVSLPVNRNGIW
jgi:hypothetical protein